MESVLLQGQGPLGALGVRLIPLVEGCSDVGQVQHGGSWATLSSGHTRLQVCHHSGPPAWAEIYYNDVVTKRYRAPWPGQARYNYTDLPTHSISLRRRVDEGSPWHFV